MSGQNTEMASKCFQWVAAAKRPLSVNELREAISIEIGQEYLKPERLPNNMKNISSFCENLVNVDEEKKIVQFAHHTVKQFLTDEISEPEFRAFHFNLKDMDHLIGEICVTYLNFNDFNTTLIRRPRPPQQVVLSDIGRTAVGSEKKSHGLLEAIARLKLGATKKSKAVDFVGALSDSKPEDTQIVTDEDCFSFLKYASANMFLHTKQFSQERSLTWSPWKRMVEKGSELFQYPWGSASFLEDGPVILTWCFDNAHAGLIRLIDSYREIPLTKELNNALCRHVEACNLDLVGALLASGADPNAISEKGMSVISMAASLGSLDIVDKLLLSGAKVNTYESDTIPPLHIAVQNGNIDIVNRLLSRGAIANRVFQNHSALRLASERGHMEICEALAKACADSVIEADGIGGQLILAAMHGDTEILLERKVARYIAHEGYGDEICDAIYTAVINDHPDVIEKILDVRFNLHDPDNNDMSTADVMLWEATACGHLGVLEYALARGAGADMTSRRDFLTASLQKAAEMDRRDMVEALLAVGARMNFPDGPEVILEIAVKHGSLEILKKALAAGADVNALFEFDGDESYTALHIAANRATQKVLQRLVKDATELRPSSSDSNLVNDYDLATERAFLRVINTLINAGADVNRKTGSDLTPLGLFQNSWNSAFGDSSREPIKLQTDEGRLALEAALRRSSTIGTSAHSSKPWKFERARKQV